MRNRFALLGKSRSLLAVLVTATVLALVGTTMGYAALNKEVTLSLDGEARTVDALGSTVGDVLDSQGIDVGRHDIVAPGLDEAIDDGTRISVRFGRPLELTVDGKEQTHWVTATDVDSALAEIGKRFLGADLSVSRGAGIDREGMALEVVTPKTLTIKVGDRHRVSESVAGFTVRDVLDELDVDYDKNDIVKPRLGAKLKEGMDVTLTKVRIEKKKVDGEAIDFDTIERTDSSMFEGESETVRSGRAGARDVVYRIEYRNGELFATRVVRADVTRKPVDAVVEVGTKERPEPAAPAPNFASGGTVWDRLAQCESGGNWAINTGNGYYGGLQFSLSTWRSVGGTGYPHQHSREEQIKRGQILQSRAGWGQWPHCSAQLGLR